MMIHKVTSKMLLILISTYIIWDLIHFYKLMPKKASNISLPKRIASPNSSSHNADENGYDNGLEERSHVYRQRRERVKAVCDSHKNIHNPKEGERFIFDVQNGIAFCMNMKVRISALPTYNL